jgi:chorismate mutase-like protein
MLAAGVLAALLAFQADAELAKARQRIDAIDTRIVDLLNERARVVEEVGEIKRKAGLPVYVPDREAAVVKRAGERSARSGGPLPASVVERIYKSLVEQMREWESKSAAAQ